MVTELRGNPCHIARPLETSQLRWETLQRDFFGVFFCSAREFGAENEEWLQPNAGFPGASTIVSLTAPELENTF